MEHVCYCPYYDSEEIFQKRQFKKKKISDESEKKNKNQVRKLHSTLTESLMPTNFIFKKEKKGNIANRMKFQCFAILRKHGQFLHTFVQIT